MQFPRSRAEAEGTKHEALWQTPPHWPDHVRLVPIADYDKWGLDGSNQLYWDGVPVLTRNTIRLEGWTLFFAAAATMATAVSALWPITLHFHWFGW
ncbi:hypothetical protein [Devosia aurantiaca]|uniref:Uncharacterized protein n=1 Tax=Devosia aurantiaca TaxID=2714858 RepID=A0A6M1SHH3_9HYPH|nr:hypothetical protein [Devosia aurantiaca]NGP18907.1 hypothetical protein [Devosia aurantiaca]